MQSNNMKMIFYWDRKLKIRLHDLEAYIIAITTTKKQQHWFDVSISKDAFFQDVFQMTAITLVSAINYYHINGLHLFWDTLYIYIYIYIKMTNMYIYIYIHIVYAYVSMYIYVRVCVLELCIHGVNSDRKLPVSRLWQTNWWETDCYQVPLTLCPCYPNLNVHALSLLRNVYS